MTQDQEISPPSDVCLLLRAHAEQRWLSLEVGPVLRQLQQRDGLPEEQLGAALRLLMQHDKDIKKRWGRCFGLWLGGSV